MDGPKRRSIPFFPIAVVVAVAFLGLFLLILDRVEDEELQRTLFRLLIGVFVGGLGMYTWVSVQWRRGRSEYRRGREWESASARLSTDAASTGNVWASTSTFRQPRRIKMDRKELAVWKEVGRATGLTLERSRNPRLRGTIREIEVRVDPVMSGSYETRVRAALPISLKGKVVATIEAGGPIRIDGAPPDLEAALRDSPVTAWLTAAGDATLEIEAQGARAFAPEIADDPDLLRGLIELAVSTAEAVTVWHRTDGARTLLE